MHTAPFPQLTRLGGVAVAAQVQHQVPPVGQGLGFHRTRQCSPALGSALAAHPVVLLVGQEHLEPGWGSRGRQCRLGSVNRRQCHKPHWAPSQPTQSCCWLARSTWSQVGEAGAGSVGWGLSIGGSATSHIGRPASPPTCECSGGLRMYTPSRSATAAAKAEQCVATPEVASGLLARPLNQATCSSFSQWLLTLRESRNAARTAPSGVTTCAAAQAACGQHGRAEGTAVYHGAKAMAEDRWKSATSDGMQGGWPGRRQAAGRTGRQGWTTPAVIRLLFFSHGNRPLHSPIGALAHLLGWGQSPSAARAEQQQRRCPHGALHLADN